MSAHIDDDAELYALGALEASERETVDAHLATCDACTQRVADAERTVGALGSFAWGSTVAPSPRSDARASVRWSVVAAVLAACFALALGFGLRERSSLATIETSDAAIVATLATSHFAHTPFVANVAGAPVAKVLYARDGSWLYVVVDAGGAWKLFGIAHGKPIDFGPLASRGGSSILYVAPRVRTESLTLVTPDGTVVAHVRPAYSGSP